MQLAQGHTGWLFWGVQWGNELPTFTSAARTLIHLAILSIFLFVFTSWLFKSGELIDEAAVVLGAVI